jgi:L-fuconolactonase
MTDDVPNRDAWRDQIVETPIDPELPIIDPHHHIWPKPPVPGSEEWGAEGLFEYMANCGHNITATMFVESGVEHRADGPPHLACVGETEFAEGVAREAQSRGGRIDGAVAGIIAGVEMLRGGAVADVLDAHIEASPRVHGVRSLTAWDADMPYDMGTRPGMLVEPSFREAVAELAPRDLVLDVWLMHPQIPDLAALAGEFEHSTFVLDHVGAPMGIGRFASDPDAVFAEWDGLISRLAQFPNVAVKLGGLNMPLTGLCVAEDASAPWTSQKMADVQGRYVRRTIELFGSQRCMFESNFPVDRALTSGNVLWNGFKRMVADLSADERHSLFFETANRIYRLNRSAA